MWSLCALCIGFCIDLILGDPHNIPHPVVLIGKLISSLEKLLRKLFPKTVLGENWAGGILWLLVVTISTAVPVFLLRLCYGIHVYLGLALESFLCAQILATKSLKDESMKVYAALKTGDLAKSRYAVSMIVGRDTDRLDDKGVARAAVETVAENTSDGIVAPLIFLTIGGVPMGFFYKAVNTMDSMVGYKNDRYRFFGTAAARLDDVCNFLPARISGLLMCLGAFLGGMDGKNALRIFRRDRYKHASPNSAQTEAAMAGALDVQLSGDAWYFGKLVKKKTIGDPVRRIETEDIKRADRLMLITSALAAAVFLLCRYTVCTQIIV